MWGVGKEEARYPNCKRQGGQLERRQRAAGCIRVLRCRASTWESQGQEAEEKGELPLWWQLPRKRDSVDSRQDTESCLAPRQCGHRVHSSHFPSPPSPPHPSGQRPAARHINAPTPAPRHVPAPGSLGLGGDQYVQLSGFPNLHCTARHRRRCRGRSICKGSCAGKAPVPGFGAGQVGWGVRCGGLFQSKVGPGRGGWGSAVWHAGKSMVCGRQGSTWCAACKAHGLPCCVEASADALMHWLVSYASRQ